MRPLALSLLLVGLAAAKAGPDTALKCRVEPGPFRDVRLVERPSCPPTWELCLTMDLPDPGWKLACDGVTAPDAEHRLVVRLTATHGEGMWPQVMTPATVKVPVGPMKKGVDLLDVQLRRAVNQPYERVAALLLRGE